MKYTASKRITSLILAVVMLFLLIPTSIFAAVSESLAGLGRKEPSGPSTLKYIYTREDLENVKNDLDATYILMNDIDLSGKDWTPIGDLDTPFTGTFLGACNTISGMTIGALPEASSNGCYYIGLFGYNKGQIRDLKIEGVGSIPSEVIGSAYCYAGNLVGYNNGKIIGCADDFKYKVDTDNALDFVLEKNEFISIRDFYDVNDWIEDDISVSPAVEINGAAIKITGNLADNNTNNLDFTITANSESAYSAHYIFLEDANINNFTFTSDKLAKEIYIISRGESNTLRAQNGKAAFYLPYCNITILGEAQLHIYGGLAANASSGNIGKQGHSAITAKNVCVSNNAETYLYGGDGGRGGNGYISIAGITNAAKGGDAGYAVTAENFCALSKVYAYTGNAGTGGNGDNFQMLTYKLGTQGANGGDVPNSAISAATVSGTIIHVLGKVGNPGTNSSYYTGPVVPKKGTCDVNWKAKAEIDGKEYFVYQTVDSADISYDDAKAALPEDEKLISINSAEEQIIAAELQKLVENRHAWIGLQRKSVITGNESDTYTWVFADGTEFEEGNPDVYTNWGDGEPSFAESQEVYAHLSTDGFWNDNLNTFVKAYISEKDVESKTAENPALYYGRTYNYSTPEATNDLYFGDYTNYVPKYSQSELTSYDNALYLSTTDNPYAILIGRLDASIADCEIHEDAEFIYSYAFASCEAIKAIKIPNNVKGIGNYAFYKCTTLKAIELSKNLKTIGDYAFYGCSELNDITLPDSLAYFGICAFRSCSSLESIKIPSGVTKISDAAFAYNGKLTYVYIPSTVTEIGDSAFYQAEKLERVEFEGRSNVKSIGATAFFQNKLLEYFDFGENLEVLSDRSFCGCLSLKNIYISKNVRTIYSNTFYQCGAVEEIVVNPENPKYSSKGNALTNVQTKVLILGSSTTSIRESGAESIKDYAFYNTKFENAIEIPEYITYDESPFYNCSGEIILLGENRNFMREGSTTLSAFSKCQNLRFYKYASTVIPDNYVSFEIIADGQCGENAYYIIYDSDLDVESSSAATLFIYGSGETYDYSDGRPTIEEEIAPIFNSYRNLLLYTAEIDSGITKINPNLFKVLTNITTIQVGESVESIAKDAFFISNGIHSLDVIAFEGSCPSIDKDAISSTRKVQIIRDTNALGWEKNGLPYVCFIKGAGLSTEIPDEAHYYEIDASNGLSYVNSAGYDKYGLHYSVNIENKTATVEGFDPDKSLDSEITIPLQILQGGNFYNVTTIKSLNPENSKVIHRNLTFTINTDSNTADSTHTGISVIGNGAFASCTAQIYFVGNAISTPSDAFAGGSYVIVNDNTSGWIEVFGGATVYKSSVLQDNKDASGIYYTINLEDKTAMVGKKSKVEDNAVNTSGAKDVLNVKIPNFVTYNGAPYKVTAFDRYAFYGNKTLQTIEFGSFIGEGQTELNPAIWDCTFRSTESLKSIKTANNPYYYTAFDSYTEGMLMGSPLNDESGVATYTRLIKCPEDANFTSVNIYNNQICAITVIENYAFAGQKHLTELIINDNVTVIGSHAFYNTNLQRLEGSYQFHDIGDSAFENSSISSITFTEALATIGTRAFYNTKLTGSIVLNYNTVSIGEKAFARCAGITEFKFRDFANSTDKKSTSHLKYTTDDYGALYSNGELGYNLMQFPASADGLSGEKLFVYDMTSASIPVTYSISSEAFFGASHVSEIIMNDSTVIVGSEAFSNCPKLLRVTIGKSYYGSSTDESYGVYSYDLFRLSTSLKYIEVHPENKYFVNDSNGVLYSRDTSSAERAIGSTLYCYPAGIDRVSYTIPASVTKIYDSAFYANTHIKQITVSSEESVYVGSRAFGDCSSLGSVYYGSKNVPTAGEKIYDNTSATLKTLYKSEYKTLGWSVYVSNPTALFSERGVGSYDIVTDVPNDTLKTNDYLIIFKDSENTPLEDVSVIVTVYMLTTNLESGEDVWVEHKFYLTSDDNGRIAFSTLKEANNGEEITIRSDVHMYAVKEGYFTYDRELALDEEMLITYLTLTKEPDVFGVTFDGKDINSQTAKLNRAEYSQNYDYTDANGYTSQKTLWKNVKIKVLGFYDTAYGNPVFELVQNGAVIPVQSLEIIGSECTFTVSAEYLTDNTPLEVRMTVYKGGDVNSDDTLSIIKILNINVFTFSISAEDVNLEMDDASIDLSGAPEIFKQLFGQASFDIELGKNVSLSTVITDSTATITVTAEKDDFIKGVKTDYKKGWEQSDDKYGHYFFLYSDGILTYDIRFALTDVSDYVFYKVYVYGGWDYDDVFLQGDEGTVYGGLNLNSLEAKRQGRSKVTMRALQLYMELTSWIYDEITLDEGQDLVNYIFEKAQNGHFRTENCKLTKEKYVPSDEYGDKYSSTKKLTMGLEGKIVFEYGEDQAFHLASSSLKGYLEFSYKHHSQMVIGFIPVTMDIEVSLGGDITLKLKFDNPEDKVKLDELALTLKADIEANIGYGCVIASIGVYGSAGTIFILDIQPDFKVREWEVHGNLGVYYKILWHKKTFEIWSGKHYIIKDGLWTKTASKSYSTASLYLANTYEFTADCDENATIIKIGDNYFKIYFENVTGEGYDEYNSTKLVYSKWNEEIGEFENDYTVICDNGFSDAAYSVYENGEKIYLVFTEQTKKINAASASDTYAAAEGLSLFFMDISWGFDEAELTEIVNGEESEDYKYLATSAEYRGKNVVAWAENSDNNIFGVSPENRSEQIGSGANAEYEYYVYETSANSIWLSVSGDAVCILDGLSTVMDIEIANGYVYYIIDKDGDLSDSSDCALYSLPIANAADSEPTLIAEGVSLVDANGGKLTYYSTNASDTGLKSTDASINLPTDSSYLANGYKTVLDTNGKISAILFTESKNDKIDEDNSINYSVLYAVFLEDGVWGEPVAIYSPNEEDVYITSYDAELCENALILTLQLNDKNGNSISRDYSRSYDLTNISLDYTFEINYESQTVTYSVTNFGATKIEVTLGSVTKEILSGRTEEFTVAMVNKSTEQINTIYAECKPYATISTIYHTVNTQYADLKPLAKQIVIGENNSMLIAIRNYGNHVSGASKLYVLPGTATGGESNELDGINQSVLSGAIAVIDISPIDAGRIAYYEISLDESSLPAGTGIISLYVCENKSGYEPDSCKTNNLSAFYLSEVSQTVVGSFTPGEESSEIYVSSNDFFINSKDGIVVTASHGKDATVTITSSTLTDFYTLTKISSYFTELVISPAKLNTLTAGMYTFTVTFTDSEGNNESVDFTVNVRAASLPDEEKVDVSWVVDGETVDSDSIAKYTIPSTEVAPTKVGYKFVGWDSNSDGIADEITLVTEDTTYVAVFEKSTESLTVSWIVSPDGSVKVTKSVQSGEAPVAPLLNYNGIAIQGWDKDGDGIADAIDAINENTTYVAVYLKVSGSVSIKGSTTVGETLVADIDGITDGENSIDYVWYVGADVHYGSSYRILASDIGKEIYLAVVGIGDYIGTITSETKIISAHEGYVLHVSLKPATCEQDGNIEYWFCESCGYYFSDALCTITVDKSDTVIKALNHSYKATITDPTCTAGGYTTHVCSTCSHTYTDSEVEKLNHSYNSVTTAPTCTADGYTTHTCSRCSHTYVDAITGKVAHDYKSTVTAPTCTTVGYTTYVCEDCGNTCTDNETAKLNHSYNSTVTAPTCTSEGYTTYVCEDCNYTYVDDATNKLAHVYKTTLTAPTCTTVGYTTYVCEDCGNTYTDNETAKLNHSYNSTVTAPTCTNEGYTTYVCKDCGNTYTDDVTEKVNHEYTSTVTAPTCTSAGYTTHVCKNCSYTYVDAKTDAIAHTSSDWIVDVDADCINSGSKHKECSACHTYLEYAIIPTESHAMGEWVEVSAPTCTTAGQSKQTCGNCDYFNLKSIEALNHDFANDYTTDTAPTCHSLGIESRHCSRCDATTDSRSIEMTAHVYDSVTVTLEASASKEGVKTYTCSCGSVKIEMITKLAPKMTEISNETWTSWSKKDSAVFRSNAAFEDFIEVKINGEALSPDHYTLREGSVVIEISGEYLKTLKNGEYTVEIVSTTGVASSNMVVKKNFVANPWVCGSAATAVTLGAAAFALLFILKTKKNDE